MPGAENVDIFQVFFGILVLSFIIERFFEIASSIMDYCYAEPKDVERVLTIIEKRAPVGEQGDSAPKGGQIPQQQSYHNWLDKQVQTRRIFSPLWGIKTSIDHDKAMKLAPVKKLFFTPIGLLIGYEIVMILGAGECGILHCTKLLDSSDQMRNIFGYQLSNDKLDAILTAVAISGGTGPIHNFMDILQKGSKDSAAQADQGAGSKGERTIEKVE